MLKLYERILCCVIAVILFFMGMCLDTTKADSSFSYSSLGDSKAVLYSVDYLMESPDSCTVEMMGKRGTSVLARGEAGRNAVRLDRSILLSMIVGAILQYLLYFRSSVCSGYCEIQSSSTVAINYIHRKDGEK